MVHNGDISLPWKRILFRSHISDISYTYCYVLQGYTVICMDTDMKCILFYVVMDLKQLMT